MEMAVCLLVVAVLGRIGSWGMPWLYWEALAVLRCIGANLPYPPLPLCPLIGVAQVAASTGWFLDALASLGSMLESD